MKTRYLLSALIAATFSTPVLAEDIPVSRVILSTSGLANFELRAKVNGDAALQFPVRLEQVDDILKSLVVFDAKGRLGGVTLPGRQPLAQTFRDLPFSQGQLASPMMLLNAYQGATLTIKGPNISATGRILQVVAEDMRDKNDETTTRHRLSLMTSEGLKQAVLEDLTSIQFDNQKAKEEITRALDSIRENAAAGRRDLTVNLKGEGARDVALSYVVDAPLWKTAYRMVLPEGDKKEGLLQGWAVIENMTAADWKDVDLTLVSGNPVTYRQSLYTSYYVDRPEIPVQVFGRVMPRVDEGTIATAGMVQGNAQEFDNGASQLQKEGRADSLQEWKRTAQSKAIRAEASGSLTLPVPMAAPAPAVMAAMDSVAQSANAAQSAEATTQVLFRFPDKFTLKSGQSMMLPFVSRSVPMERVFLYQPETHPTHPLAAVEIRNDGDSGLPPGILTLYEESSLLKGTGFVGDAQMPVTSPGEKRMVSYALDSKTNISREDKSTSTEDRVTISQGVINIAVLQRNETDYTVKAPEKEDRLVILEHPKIGPDYKLVSPEPDNVEVTQTHYRIRVPLKAGESKTVPVILENTLWQSWSIDSLPQDRLLAYAGGQGKLNDETRETFKALAEIRKDIDAIDSEIAEADRRRQVIFEDQTRVRENLNALHDKSDVQQKYLDKLNEQEDQIAKLDAQKEKLVAAREEKMRAMQEKIAGMKN